MRFEDLSSIEIRAMNRLAGWASDGPPIGTAEDMLPATLLEGVIGLEHLGLASVDTDTLGVRWWHLTERGWRVRDIGEA